MALSTIDTSSISGLGYGYKNRITNGGMAIDQRNAGASGTSGGYTVDRWFYDATQASKGTWQQNAGSVTPPTGFKNYLGFTSSSAYTVLTADEFRLGQAIEGYNMADFGWGTSSALTIAISFWVRSSLTGTFGGSLTNNGATRSYPFSYTINSANTWEYKTIIVSGDTTGTWLSTNGAGILLNIGLGVGATYSGTAGAWAGTNYISSTGATSVVGTSGATFYITGVQLEAGTVATSFDWRPYGTEFALCSRYFQYNIIVAFGGGQGPSNTNRSFYCPVNWPVQMRSTPTMTLYNTVANSGMNSANWANLTSYGGLASCTNTIANDVVLIQNFNASAEL